MRATMVGLFVGLALGFAFALGGLDDMVLVAFFGLIGYVVARVLEDNRVEIGEYFNRMQGQRRP
jgi:hypothetical protein